MFGTVLHRTLIHWPWLYNRGCLSPYAIGEGTHSLHETRPTSGDHSLMFGDSMWPSFGISPTPLVQMMRHVGSVRRLYKAGVFTSHVDALLSHPKCQSWEDSLVERVGWRNRNPRCNNKADASRCANPRKGSDPATNDVGLHHCNRV